MDVVEMHVMFREITQQMGMQTIRAILSEDIDTCLNIAVNDYIKKLIADNVKMSGNNKTYIDNAKVGQINALNTLVSTLEFSNISIDSKLNTFSSVENVDNLYLIMSGSVYYDGKFGGYSARLIDSDYLYQTLNDFCNRATFDNPILTFGDLSIPAQRTVKIYIFTGDHTKDINIHEKPLRVVLNILKKPNVITYVDDTSNSNVNCNLPDYTHIDIVKAAAELYLRSVVSTSN